MFFPEIFSVAVWELGTPLIVDAACYLPMLRVAQDTAPSPAILYLFSSAADFKGGKRATFNQNQAFGRLFIKV